MYQWIGIVARLNTTIASEFNNDKQPVLWAKEVVGKELIIRGLVFGLTKYQSAKVIHGEVEYKEK